ncbi:unnamed protein product [Somion occarium]|uniref:Zuotin-like zuotin homology domain-containing protein n=1 Tax=Somion occarium TaxID=3059160 RepID=A0ABP1DN94_9APHY
MPGYFQPDPPRPRAPKSSDLVPEDILVGLDYLPTSGARGYVPKDLLYFFVPIVNNQFGTNMWGDEPKSFVTIYREVFTLIAQDELRHGKGKTSLPSFGQFSTPWVSRRNRGAVKCFYDVWKNFSTTKNFSCFEIVTLNSNAPREERRYVNAINKKFKTDLIRLYNERVSMGFITVHSNSPNSFRTLILVMSAAIRVSVSLVTDNECLIEQRGCIFKHLAPMFI